MQNGWNILYYIVITVLVFNSLAWRCVDGRGAPSGVIASVIVAGLGVVYTSTLCAGLLVLCVFPLSSVFFSSCLWSWIGAGSRVAVLRVVLFGRGLYDVNSLFELYPVYGFTACNTLTYIENKDNEKTKKRITPTGDPHSIHIL